MVIDGARTPYFQVVKLIVTVRNLDFGVSFSKLNESRRV